MFGFAVQLGRAGALRVLRGRLHRGSPRSARAARRARIRTRDRGRVCCVRGTRTARRERVAAGRAPRLHIPERGRPGAGRALRRRREMQ